VVLPRRTADPSQDLAGTLRLEQEQTESTEAGTGLGWLLGRLPRLTNRCRDRLVHERGILRWATTMFRLGQRFQTVSTRRLRSCSGPRCANVARAQSAGSARDGRANGDAEIARMPDDQATQVVGRSGADASKDRELNRFQAGSSRGDDHRPVQGRDNSFAGARPMQQPLRRCTRHWSSQRDDPTTL